MKTIALFIIFLFTVNVYSQSGWEVVYPGVQANSKIFIDVSFMNNETGWVLGTKELRKTTNSGLNWTKFNIAHANNSYRCFFFINENVGWVLESAYLNITSNGGESWQSAYVPTGPKSVFFRDVLTGWMCGANGSISKSTNSGFSWTAVPSGFTDNLNAIAFVNDDIGICGGDWGTILSTTNGGANWSKFTDSYLGFFTAVKFLNPSNVFVSGTGGNIYRSTNGGLNWTPVYVNTSLVTSVRFGYDYTGYAFGSASAMLKSTDFGASWSFQQPPGLFAQVNAASVTQSDHIWAAADSGIIYRSTNLGSTWSESVREYITSTHLNSVSFLNSSTGFAFGNSGIVMKTTNGGSNWQNGNLNSSYSFSSSKFLNSSTGYICGGEGYYMGIVYKTVNGGSSWQQVYLDSAHLNSLSFINENTGWAGGTFGNIIKTTNGGVNWVRTKMNSVSAINSIYFVNAQTGFAGVSGTTNTTGIHKTTDGGANWDRVSIYPTWSMQFIGNTGYAISTYGSIQYLNKSTDLGDNWVNYNTGANSSAKLFFVNNETGWLNSATAFRKTTNGGINWLSQQIPGGQVSVLGLYFLDALTGWGVGQYGGIVKTVSGGIGIQPINSSIPSGYELSQNYPNPFNPMTKLKFSIPLLRGVDGEAGRGVLLKVHDILGKEIAVLVNENLKPGTYEIEWDASGVSSGVYFYSLITNEFTQTKKMVVLK